MALKILNNCRPLSSYSQSLSSRRGLQEKSIWDCLFQSPVDHQIIAIFPWSSFADSVQTEYCTTFLLSVCLSVTGVTSHISHIYKGINAMLIIKPYIF